MYLYLSCVMISVVCVRLHVISPMVSFHHRNYFSPFCGRTKIRDIYGQKKFRRLPLIFTHQFSPTTLTDTHSYTRTNTHSNSPVWFHPTISTHALSLTNFIHPFFTNLFSPTPFHPFFFHPHRFLSPAVPQKSIFTHDSLRSGFTNLQISPTCRFHILEYFIYLHLSCWLMFPFFLSFLGFEGTT